MHEMLHAQNRTPAASASGKIIMTSSRDRGRKPPPTLIPESNGSFNGPLSGLGGLSSQLAVLHYAHHRSRLPSNYCYCYHISPSAIAAPVSAQRTPYKACHAMLALPLYIEQRYYTQVAEWKAQKRRNAGGVTSVQPASVGKMPIPALQQLGGR